MRAVQLAVIVIPILLAGCGSTERTVVVNPPAGSGVVVPPNGEARVCPQGTANC